MRAELAGAGNGLGPMVAGVLTKEILANPARAMHQMSIASLDVLTVDQVTDTIEPFVTALGR